MSISPEARGFLVNAIGGWRALDASDRLVVGDELRLRPIPGRGRPLTTGDGSFAGLADATGLAVDGDGTAYVLDATTPALWRFDPCDPRWVRLPCIAGYGSGRRDVRAPNGLAITRRRDLVIADTGNRRVQLFSIKGLVLRTILGPYRVDDPTTAPAPIDVDPGVTPPAGTWWPWDVAVRPDGDLLVTDRANGLVHRFDERGRWLSATDGSGDGFAPLEEPTHLAVDRSGNVYVTHLAPDGSPAVVVLGDDGEPLEHVATSLDVDDRFAPTAVTADADGSIYVTDRNAGELRRYGRPEPAHPRRPVVVCCLDGPCGRSLAVTVDGEVATPAVRTIDLVEPEPAYSRTGRVVLGPFDSERLACRWHRVQLRADVPAGTFVQVHTYASDAKKPAVDIRALDDDSWDTGAVHDDPDASEWDCLIRGRRGRFLWLRLTLEGDGAHTPTVHRARVSGPRASTVRFLPGIYRHDVESAELLDRFVSIFDRVLDDIGDHISELPRYLDPFVTPVDDDRDFLEWLASLVGLALDRHWPLDRRRALVAEAVDLYGVRGTRDGIRRVLELYLGHGEVRILEHYRMRKWMFLGFGRLGERSELWGKEIVDRLQLDEHSGIGSFRLVDTGDPLRDPFHVHAHQFTVFVPAGDDDPTRRHAIEQIIETVKPAHTLGTLRIVEPRFRVGHALVGMDTVVAARPGGAVLVARPDDTAAGAATADTTAASELGYDTVLAAGVADTTAPTMELGRRRIGLDSVID